jgi:hypothetical protein
MSRCHSNRDARYEIYVCMIDFLSRVSQFPVVDSADPALLAIFSDLVNAVISFLSFDC